MKIDPALLENQWEMFPNMAFSGHLPVSVYNGFSDILPQQL